MILPFTKHCIVNWIAIFRAYLKYGRKIVHSNRAFFTRCLPIVYTLNDVGQIRSPLVKFFEIPKKFVWTRRMQFWQLSRNVPLEVWKHFERSPKIIMELWVIRKKCFPSKCVSGNVECSFDQPNFFVCFWKIWFFCEKNCFFFKIGQGSISAVECVSNSFSSRKCLYHLLCEFCKESKNFNFGKNTKIAENKVCYERKSTVTVLMSIFNESGGRKICWC